MDFSLTDHQLLIRDTVRQFMETEVRPHVKESGARRVLSRRSHSQTR